MDGRLLRAARDALGYDVKEDRVERAVAAHADQDTKSLRRRLRDRSGWFQAFGGRGVELAEEIDDLRIVLAVRSAERGRGGRGRGG